MCVPIMVFYIHWISHKVIIIILFFAYTNCYCGALDNAKVIDLEINVLDN